MQKIGDKIFYEAGDLVKLKCGGPPMVVCWANGDGNEIQTVWHDVNRVMQMIRLSPIAVVGIVDKAIADSMTVPTSKGIAFKDMPTSE